MHNVLRFLCLCDSETYNFYVLNRAIVYDRTMPACLLKRVPVCQFNNVTANFLSFFLQVVTPQKVGDVYLYDSPANRDSIDCPYDFPPSGQPVPVFDGAQSNYFY